MDSTVSDSLVGQLLDGRYHVESRIARGGMATVYTALDVRLERVVALKVMHPIFAEDDEFVTRFIREAKSAARLSHPNVVAVFDQGEDSGHVFLAMEYVPGRTLRDLLQERGRLSPQEALSILAPVLSALAAAHSAGLIHRDVKPENVLLADDGRVKVADFGLARAMVGRHTTTTSALIGTVAYFAPEQVTRGIADARTDVYAAGIVLFEMLTGKPPYDGDTPISVAYRHAHEDVPPPSSLVPKLPALVDTLVARATARDPDRRPADAAAFLTELQRVRRSLPALDGDTESATTFTPRGHETLVVDLTDGDSASRAGRPPIGGPPDAALIDDADAATPRRRQRGLIVFIVVLLLACCLAAAGWWYGTAGTRNAKHYTVVPNVVGTASVHLTPIQAKAALTAAHLTMLTASKPANSASSDYSETVPKGDVVSQSPLPSSVKIRKGSPVTIELSLGPHRTTVPPFIPAGATDPSAANTLSAYEALLSKASLIYSTAVKQEYSPTVPVNGVLAVVPVPGTVEKLNTSVTITVSEGPQPIPIPAVSGQSATTAQQTLQSLGFLVNPTQEYSTTVATGDVISQDPAGGGSSAGKKGDTITLSVSKGPQLFAVPNVSSDLANPASWISVSQAEEILQTAGFSAKVGSRGAFGVVTSQRPKAGSMEPKGTVVTISAH